MQQPLDSLSRALSLLESFRDSLMASLISEALPEKPPRGFDILTEVSAIIGQADIPASQLLRQLARCLEPAGLPWTEEQFGAWENALSCAVARLEGQITGRTYPVDPLAVAQQSLRRLGVGHASDLSDRQQTVGEAGRNRLSDEAAVRKATDDSGLALAASADWRPAEMLDDCLAQLETLIDDLEQRVGLNPEV